MATTKAELSCPACGVTVEGWAHMLSHFQSISDGPHNKLEDAVERATVDAYINAERSTVKRLCAKRGKGRA